MSYANFEKAMELAQTMRYYRCAGEMSDELIGKVENKLGVKMSRQHYTFLRQYGDVSCGCSDFIGIHSPTQTLMLRDETNLYHDWIPIYEYGDANDAYIDYSTLNAEGEPRIVIGHYHPDGYQLLEVYAEDIGDFILKTIEWQLEPKDDDKS